ncbi:MAG: TetR/AcrR family transcriptional regulator [Myxococcota bacterium]|nr:TetR/AcrR family transcriptional regulator [Myxococcota bacterium]
MSSAPSPAARDDVGTRDRILEAALAAFSELGFDGASTRAIARRADVNLGLIQYYFESKERLWREAVARAFAALDAGLGAALREAEPLDDRARLALVVRRYVRFVAQHPEFVRLMHDEGKRDGPRMRWIVDHHVRPVFEATTRAMRRIQARGLLPAHLDPVHFHYILLGSVGLVFHQAPECRRLAGVDPEGDAFVDAHADAVIHLLLGPPPGEEAPA